MLPDGAAAEHCCSHTSSAFFPAYKVSLTIAALQPPSVMSHEITSLRPAEHAAVLRVQGLFYRSNGKR